MKKRVLRFHRRVGEPFVKVGIYTPRGRQWISTGQGTYEGARQFCDEAKIAELQMAACANILTPEVVQRLLGGRVTTCEKLLEQWLNEIKLAKAPDTIAQIEGVCRQFIAFSKVGSHPLSGITMRHVHAFTNEDGTTIRTRKTRLGILRRFFRYAVSCGLSVGNPADRVSIKRSDLLYNQLHVLQGPVQPITEDEFRKVMEHAKGFYRWATALSYWLGLRLRDVACLEWEAIQPDGIVVFTRKTGAKVELPFDDPLLGGGELRRILFELYEQPKIDPVFIFPVERALILDTARRAKISVYYGRILKRAGVAGQGKHFHSLRHSFVCRLQSSGRTLAEIGKLVGHSDETTTAIYASEITA